MMGYGLENIGRDIDCQVIRQPLGVCAAIVPFNFPAMVPLWFLPFAIATGNTFVVKPSEQVPMTQALMVRLLEQCDLPPGVVNLVHGGRTVVEAICDHPQIRAVSFVGSTPVAKAVYRRATQAGKRVQALGGAKNFIVVMPDADLERTTAAITESFFGCAGERCLAGSVLLPVGSVHAEARERLAAAARALKVGDGSEAGTGMGPVISAGHRERVVGYIERGIAEGAETRAHGRKNPVAGRPGGYFLGPTLFDGVDASMTIGREEIFGPVASITPVRTLEEAIAVMQAHPNAECDLDLHFERKGGPGVCATGVRLDGGRQHRRRGADGQVFRSRERRTASSGSEGPRPGRVRVLHGQEGRHLQVVLRIRRRNP